MGYVRASKPFALSLLAAVLAWCATGSAMAQGDTGLTSGGTLYLATNREKSGPAKSTSVFSSRQAAQLTVGSVEPGSSDNLRFPIREIDREVFAEQLSRSLEARSSTRQVLLYVHGFNNTLAQALSRAVGIANQMAFDGDVVVFSWPSLGRLLPDPGTAYRTDIGSAESSASSLVELLRMLHAAAAVERIHILAHSLGNDPTIKALAALQSSSLPGGARIGQVILCSPDVGRDEFIRSVNAFANLPEGITLWASKHDAALKASRIVFGRGIRAGEILGTMKPIIMGHVDTIDVSLEARLWVVDQNHNAYQQVGPLFADLGELLKANSIPPWRNPTKKSAHYNPKGNGQDVYWQYKN